MDILKKIKQLRDERGWSNYRLAREANLSEGSLNNLFRLGCQPTVSTLDALCKALGITLSQFFLEDNSMIIVNEEEYLVLQMWKRLDRDQKDALLVLMKNR